MSRYIPTTYVPGNPLREGEQQRIDAESERTGIDPIFLAWWGISRVLGCWTDTIPDRPQTLTPQGIEGGTMGRNEVVPALREQPGTVPDPYEEDRDA